MPWDCVDGMTAAYWRRPEAYLDHPPTPEAHGCARSTRRCCAAGWTSWRAICEMGAGMSAHGHLLELEEIDCGLRIVITPRSARYLRRPLFPVGSARCPR